jgi:hypothetical protein
MTYFKEDIMDFKETMSKYMEEAMSMARRAGVLKADEPKSEPKNEPKPKPKSQQKSHQSQSKQRQSQSQSKPQQKPQQKPKIEVPPPPPPPPVEAEEAFSFEGFEDILLETVQESTAEESGESVQEESEEEEEEPEPVPPSFDDYMSRRNRSWEKDGTSYAGNRL